MQRYFAKEKKDTLLLLNEEDWYHINTVMRMKLHDIVEVVFEGKLYLASIEQDDSSMFLSIVEECSCEEDFPMVTIAQALVTEQKMDFILQKSCELGVSSIVPFSCSRSIVKIHSKSEKKRDRWQKIVKEASEQSKRLSIPTVHSVMSIEEVSSLDFDIKILCTVNELSRSVKRVLSNVSKNDRIIIVIGPEGGFTKEEEDTFTRRGYLPVTLGDTVLRTETASLCVLSMIRYCFMR